MEKLKEWRGTIETVLLTAIAGATLVLMRSETWDKLEHLIERIVADPMAAAAAVTALVGLARAGWAAWKRDPNASSSSTSTSSPPSSRAGFAFVDVLLLVLAVAGVMLAGAALHGCGGAPRAARVALETTAQGLALGDEVAARAYASKHASALAASTSAAEYSAAMESSNRVEEALRASRAALFAAEHLLDTWDAGGREAWLAAAACLAATLVEVLEAMRAADVEIPPELASAVALTTSFVGMCSSSSSGSSATTVGGV